MKPLERAAGETPEEKGCVCGRRAHMRTTHKVRLTSAGVVKLTVRMLQAKHIMCQEMECAPGSTDLGLKFTLYSYVYIYMQIYKNIPV